MINIYAFYFKDPANNGQIRTSRKLIQSVPAGSESKIRILSATSKGDFGNAESMDFTLQPGTEYYDAFIQMRSYILVEYDGDVIFYGRVLTISNGFFGEQKLHCEGALAFLNDSYYPGSEKKERKDITIYAHMTAVINNHNSQVDDARKKIYLGEVPGNYTSATSSAQRIANASREFGASNWSTSKSVLEDLKSHYGGAFRIRYVLDTYSDKIGQYGEGNIDLNNRIVVHNPDGSISTEVSITITVGRKYVLIPTVINGQIVSDNEAINYYYDHNKYLGKFDTLATADDYAIRLHERQNWYYNIRPYGNKCYLDWVNHYFRSTVNSQTIEVGKNLIDISGSTEVSNIFTVVIPIGKTTSGDNPVYLTGYTRNGHTFGNTLTVPEICSSVYNYGAYTDSQLNSGYHQADDYKNAISSYGRIFKTVEIQEAHNQETLFTKATEWIKTNYQGGVDTFSVKAVDLHLIGENTGKILLGDRVKIKYPVGTTTDRAKIVTRTLTCTSVSYDLFNPENNQYSFGIPANMLSKTYGDDSQKKTKKSSSYKPPKNDNDDPPEPSWDDQVLQWFETHKIWKKSVGSTNPRGEGPHTTLSDGSVLFGYFIETIVSKTQDGKIQRRIWSPIIQGATPKPEDPSKVNYWWQRDGQNRPMGTNTIKPADEINTTILSNRKLFEYVYDEYGIDLKNGGLSKNKPGVYTDADGNVEISVPGVANINIGTILNPETGEVDMQGIQAIFSSALPGQDIEIRTDKYGNTGYYKVTPDGRTVMVSVDPETGDFNYIDPTTGQPTHIRDLHLEAKNSADFIGSIVTEGYAGPDGQIHIYKFGQGIEKWADGELVVAYVDGDIVRIGTRTRTKRIYLTADQVILGDDTDEQNMVQILRDAGVINGDLEPNALVANAVYTRKISAIEGRISTLEATYITSDYLLAKHTIAAGQLSAQHFYVDTGVDSEMGSYDLKNCVSLINITRSGNTYTLHIYKSTGGEIEIPSGYNATFSRAITSWEVGWSNGTYTATAIPQDQSASTTLQAISPVQGSEITVSGKSVTRQFEVKYGPDDEHTYATGYKQLITINASTVYDNGRNYVNLTEPTWNVISGSTPSHRTVSVSTTGRPTPVTKSVALYLTQGSFSNHKKYVFMRTNSTTGTVYAEVEVDATSEYNSGKYNWNNNASLYCSDISYGSTGTKTVTLIVSYSASQSVPFSVGSSKRVYFD